MLQQQFNLMAIRYTLKIRHFCFNKVKIDSNQSLEFWLISICSPAITRKGQYIINITCCIVDHEAISYISVTIDKRLFACVIDFRCKILSLQLHQVRLRYHLTNWNLRVVFAFMCLSPLTCSDINKSFYYAGYNSNSNKRGWR